MLKYLDHPRITKIIESYYGSYFESTVMVITFIKGKTLKDEHKLIRGLPGNKGFLPK